MIRIAGRWELSWNTPIKEAELWNLPIRDFDIKDWYMHPISGISQREKSVNLYERENLDVILEENMDMIHVYLEPDNLKFPGKGKDLREFKHPKDVLYIFGGVGFNPVPKYKKDKDFRIKIPTIHNKGILWPHQCLMIVLYDRLIKCDDLSLWQ